MTVYRVGPAGATVLAEDGTPMLRLRPGLRVVEGVVDTAEQYARHLAEQVKRRRGYADKVVRPTEDKGD